MSILDSLMPQFRDTLVKLIANCSAAGCTLKPTQGIRTPMEQGKLWRQSRTSAEVQAKIHDLQDHGLDFLAKCIIDAGPSNGAHVTNSVPGLSWHQWAEAVDFVWIVKGKENWSESQLIDGKNGYHVLANEAEKLGLTAGGHWNSFKDWPHIQQHSAPSPLGIYSLKQINDIMKQRFA
jgi:peptidoglycan L-alanyl-D-glutamate endopeptidase CwlK